MEELESRLLKYLERGKPAFESVKACSSQGEKVKETALAYYADANHFFEKGEFVNAFAALEYAEGWLDAGIATGLVSAKTKNREDF